MTENLNYINVAKMENFNLVNFLLDNYDFQVLPNIDTIEEMKEASHLIMTVTNANSFLTNVLSFVSVFKRNSKRECDSYKKGSTEYIHYKRIYEDYVDKETILIRRIEVLDNIKQTTSRMITIKQEIDKELSMTGNNL